MVMGVIVGVVLIGEAGGHGSGDIPVAEFLGTKPGFRKEVGLWVF